MSGLGGGLEERTASEVHATLCELVTTNAAACSAWSEYAAVLLSPATVAFFEARLPGAKADCHRRQRIKTEIRRRHRRPS